MHRTNGRIRFFLMRLFFQGGCCRQVSAGFFDENILSIRYLWLPLSVR